MGRTRGCGAAASNSLFRRAFGRFLRGVPFTGSFHAIGIGNALGGATAGTAIADERASIGFAA